MLSSMYFLLLRRVGVLYCCVVNSLVFLAQYRTVSVRYGYGVGNTVEENTSVFYLIRMSWFAVSKGMLAVKLCTNKILQFLTGSVG